MKEAKNQKRCNCEITQEIYTKDYEDGESFVSLYETKLDSLYRESAFVRKKMKRLGNQTGKREGHAPKKSIKDLFKKIDVAQERTSRFI
jgi:hypothetical protein